jgi:hypothetical protein
MKTMKQQGRERNMGESKSCPSTCHAGTWGERRYSSYSYLTSALDGDEWSTSHMGGSREGNNDTKGIKERKKGVWDENMKGIIPPLNFKGPFPLVNVR